MKKKIIINNAIKAGLRDGYNQLITKDNHGDYTIYRNYPGLSIPEDEKIIGKVEASYNKHGCRIAEYKEI